jgi:hypothetical protein
MRIILPQEMNDSESDSRFEAGRILFCPLMMARSIRGNIQRICSEDILGSATVARNFDRARSLITHACPGAQT